ncbi:MAG TPA: cytochrome c biogenesis protein CcsA [Thermoleophilia bacterium]|nr:cytochrome c biogenesis protein CcsA [Thermoleophilia bacterium]
MEQASAIVLWIAFLLYCGSFAMFLVALFARHEGLERVGLWLVAGGWTLQTAALVLRGAAAGRVPVVGAYESLSAVAWSVALVYLALEFFTRVKAIGLYVVPVVIGLLVAALTEYEAPRELMPALRSDIVVLHVIVMLTAVGALYVAGGAALIYLFEEWRLKRRRLSGVLGRLPSLATLDKLMFHATLLGLPALTMGMAAGVIRVETFAVERWWTDPMVLLSAAAWVTYAVLLWGRLRADWGGRRVAWLAITGLALMLAIRFAAVPYLSAFHTYGS